MPAAKHASVQSAPGGGPGLAAKEPLQVRIPVSIKRRFKSFAALKGIEPNELFVEVWAFYEAGLKADITKNGKS
jgi:hypothetical protein